ncbi:zinc-finger domain-containing protein [Mesobacillus harenae]|uniref:zinc-finger domain-containing protein n=1 Tax=Mesobacillus harenae TaxID=2213203 RepID=UPI001580FD5F|nr:zinc-finger domain-containing protein [Mesobacillus harenae]
MSKKELFAEVDDLTATFCKGCFVYQHFRKEKGKRYAHRFCIRECTVGEKLKLLGKELS